MNRIMIVDDSRPFLNALGAILKEAGYNNLILEESADEAIDYLAEACSMGCLQSPVDLILMDVMMPETDGIEAVTRIKKIDGLKDVPIVMVSVQDEEERIQMAFEAGAIDYINKPIKKLELRARVRSVLRLKEEMDSRKAHQKELEVLNRSLEDANLELQKLSVTDSLTAIANRRYFNTTLEKEWYRALREQSPMSIVMVDVDHFKSYNDCYGHPMGDSCLQEIASSLKSTMRRPQDVLARYGGEEFVALLPDTDLDGALKIATAMQRDIRNKKLQHQESGTGYVTVSIGIATYIPEGQIPSEDLVNAADQAMYVSKKNGRNRISIYGDGFGSVDQ